MYPVKMEANGNIYNINSDYRVALACLKAINDAEITNLERYLAVEGMLLGLNVKNEDREILKPKIEKYLRCGEDSNTPDGEVDFDYFQDEKLIKTSVRQCYNGLNLNDIEYMHWWEYNELIGGLTPDSMLNRVREIRNYDLSEIKDLKEREKMKKTKDFYKIKKNSRPVQLTDEQKESIERYYKEMGIERRK